MTEQANKQTNKQTNKHSLTWKDSELTKDTPSTSSIFLDIRFTLGCASQLCLHQALLLVRPWDSTRPVSPKAFTEPKESQHSQLGFSYGNCNFRSLPVSVDLSQPWPSEEAVDKSAEASSSVRKLSELPHEKINNSEKSQLID